MKLVKRYHRVSNEAQGEGWFFANLQATVDADSGMDSGRVISIRGDFTHLWVKDYPTMELAINEIERRETQKANNIKKGDNLIHIINSKLEEANYPADIIEVKMSGDYAYLEADYFAFKKKVSKEYSEFEKFEKFVKKVEQEINQ